jgi:6-phosphogluconolactonase
MACSSWSVSRALVFALVVLIPSAAWPASRRALAKKASKMDKLWVYIGTYTGDKPTDSKGIYRFDLDPATGKHTGRTLAAKVKSPSFLAIHPNHRFLYAVNESGEFKGQKSGAVSAFAIDPKTGDLTLLNQQPSGGEGPCHLVVDRQGKHVLAANYTGGSASVLPIGSDGKLGKATAFVQHKGSSVNKDRQEKPHAHSINLDPTNHFAFVADLGLDKVLIYRYDAGKGTLKANDPPAVDIAPGSGPRHFAFHPSGKYAYAINELKNTVTAFQYDPERGVLKTMQTVPTLPEGFKKDSWTAEVQVHPSGKFLYGSNRGHNSIAVFALDPKTGKLTPKGQQAAGIKTPRNFGMDPSGTWMLVGNQDSNSIVVFRIDSKTGKLTPTENGAKVPMPVCVKMMPAGG